VGEQVAGQGYGMGLDDVEEWLNGKAVQMYKVIAELQPRPFPAVTAEQRQRFTDAISGLFSRMVLTPGRPVGRAQPGAGNAGQRRRELHGGRRSRAGDHRTQRRDHGPHLRPRHQRAPGRAPRRLDGVSDPLAWIAAVGGVAATAGAWLGPVRARWQLRAERLGTDRARWENELHRRRPQRAGPLPPRGRQHWEQAAGVGCRQADSGGVSQVTDTHPGAGQAGSSWSFRDRKRPETPMRPAPQHDLMQARHNLLLSAARQRPHGSCVTGGARCTWYGAWSRHKQPSRRRPAKPVPPPA
jgi:hypothetical protein